VLLLFKYVSLGSMIGAVAFPLLLLLIPRFQPDKPALTIFGFLLAALVVYTHRKNIGRLLNGDESKVNISLFGKRS
jgi:glycerol-3-phosphate acyltransferase PlsY